MAKMLDVLVCVGPADVDELLAASLCLLFVNFEPLDRVHLVTPDPVALRSVVRQLPEHHRERVSVWADAKVCPEASDLDPWFRQQYIKLHADRLTDKPYIVVLGADTLVLDRVRVEDLFTPDGRPILRYFRYDRPNGHLRFERGRVLNVARLLGIVPCRSLLPGDFICDLFVFDTALLCGLRARFGPPTRLVEVLRGLGHRQGWDDRFGEWTSYAVFCLDVAPGGVSLRAGTSTFFRQVHTDWELRDSARYACQVVHFAWKPADRRILLDDLAGQGRLPKGLP